MRVDFGTAASVVSARSLQAHSNCTVPNESLTPSCTWRYSHITSFTCIIAMRILQCSAAVGSRIYGVQSRVTALLLYSLLQV